MKNIKNVWLIFALIWLVLIVGLFLAFDYVLVFVSLWFLVLILLLWNGRVVVPEKHEYVISFLGKYLVTLEPGLYFPFPGIHQIDGACFLGVDERNLFDASEKIDFSSSLSAKVKAKVSFKIINSKQWTYGAEDSTEMMVLKVARELRAFLESKEYEKINSNRGIVNLDSICSQNEIFPANGSYVGTFFFQKIKDDFGIELISIILQDIELSAEEERVRMEKYKAEKEEEVAEIKKRTTIINANAKAKADKILAEARRIALAKEGEGYKNQLYALKAIMTKEEAVEFLKHYEKWRNLSDKAVVINDAEALGGARFGAGFRAGGTP